MSARNEEWLQVIAMILINRDIDVCPSEIYAELVECHDIDRMPFRAVVDECVGIARELKGE